MLPLSHLTWHIKHDISLLHKFFHSPWNLRFLYVTVSTLNPIAVGKTMRKLSCRCHQRHSNPWFTLIKLAEWTEDSETEKYYLNSSTIRS